jgi:uncharacterized protein (DUF2062 family)
MATIPSFRSLLKQVLHLQESPQRTALAFAIGVSIGFSPAYGLHTIMVLFCTWALGLNFLALMAGAFINNPWTLVPILGATYWVGALLLGRSDSPSFDWNDMSFGAIYEQVIPYAMPFLLGGLVLSLLGAALAYPLAYYFVSKYRQSHPPAQTEPLPPP